MIIEISKPDFRSIASNCELDLPKRWDGNDFHESLKLLYEHYQSILLTKTTPANLRKVTTICNGISKCIEHYHNGFPNKAFHQMDSVMKKLIKHPLTVYRKSGWTDAFDQYDPLMLFRIRNVQNNTHYLRKDIFHTPYNLRSKISTCRYSISGYPCLYLGTSLDLCCEEAKVGSFNDMTITSRFKIQRNMRQNDGLAIDVIELALKPKDFIDYDRNAPRNIRENNIIGRTRNFNELDLDSIDVMSAYLYWYPLIAACSFIRVNKQDPFASEYIIPQLLMQWARNESNNEKLIGIRYFSCASERASELGFNYVFPVSCEKDPQNEKYCKVLARSFKLTTPVYIHEFNTISDCEYHLQNSTDFDRI
ncbi:RES family NAD+ phosphorylase [Acetoanaerobium noterae]|uniref:RES family NAD+ phosphorylase n=1 Tax=Acetoanaerobium noterae TaxID=745369 RepID=UPI003242B855